MVLGSVTRLFNNHLQTTFHWLYLLFCWLHLQINFFWFCSACTELHAVLFFLVFFLFVFAKLVFQVACKPSRICSMFSTVSVQTRWYRRCRKQVADNILHPSDFQASLATSDVWSGSPFCQHNYQKQYYIFQNFLTTQLIVFKSTWFKCSSSWIHLDVKEDVSSFNLLMTFIVLAAIMFVDINTLLCMQ